MSVKLREPTTRITFDEIGPAAMVCTHSRYLMGRVEKLARERPGECRIIEYTDDGRGIRCIVPRGWIRIQALPRYSEKELKARSDRLKRYWKSRSKRSGAGA